MEKGIFASRWKTILCLGVLSFPSAVLIQGDIWLQLVSNLALTIVVMMFYIRGSTGKCILLAIVLQGLLWLSDVLALLAAPWLAQNDAARSRKEDFLIALLVKMFLLLLLMVMNIVFRRRDARYIRARDWLVFLAVPIFSMAVTVSFIRNMELVRATGLEAFFAEMALGFAAMNVIMFYFMQNIARREHLLHERALLDMEARSQTQLYKTIMEKVQGRGSFRMNIKTRLPAYRHYVGQGNMINWRIT